MLHITNGTSVSLDQAGLPGEIIYWMDSLNDGPVPERTFEELSRIREEFLTAFFDRPPGDISFKLRNEAITDFRTHQEVVLWFEHDLYDQLQLLQILDWFGSQDLASTRLSLICLDRYLGQLQPEELASLFPSRRPVTRGEFETAQTSWAAFRSPDPQKLQAQIWFVSSNLPFLGSALERFLEEFPSPADGLSRTERQALRLIHHAGAIEFADLFAANQRLEPAVFLGDWSFRQYLRRLAFGKHPLLSCEGTRYTLTPVGCDVLEGKQNNLRLNGIDRWFGGVHLCTPPQ